MPEILKTIWESIPVGDAATKLTTLAAIAAVIMFVGWFFGLFGWFFALFRMSKKPDIAREDYDRLKGLIGQSMLCGRMLYTVNQPDREKAKTSAGRWKARTCNLITAGLGPGEIWRFMSDNGIVVYSGNKDAIDLDVERRLFRLNEILLNLLPDKCSPSFDPKKWEDQFDLDEFA